MSFEINLPLDTITIQQLLPHRYPFLLVDRVVEFEPARREQVACAEIRCAEVKA